MALVKRCVIITCYEIVATVSKLVVVIYVSVYWRGFFLNNAHSNDRSVATIAIESFLHTSIYMRCLLI
jgi:hypothetical protein